MIAAQVVERGEQGEVPRRVVERAGLRQVADFVLVVDHFAVGGEGELLGAFVETLAGQGLQLVERRPVILQAVGQAVLGVIAQRAHGLEAPGRVAGEDDDAILVADKGFEARALPALFQGFEAHLDHGHADDLAVFFQAMGQVVAGLAVGAADAVEAPGLAAYGVLEIGAKGQVFTLVTVGIAPVTGGQHTAGGVHHVDGPTATASVQAFKVVVDGLAGFLVRIGQQFGNAGLQLKEAGQVGVFAQLAFDGAGVQLQLAFAVVAEGADAIVVTDPEADITQADHQGDDQRRQEQLANQAWFHGK